MLGKNTLVTAAVAIVLLGGGAYWYLSRPVAAPSVPIADTVTPVTGANNDVPKTDAHTFVIAQDRSTVSFTLNEVLRGTPTVVVGTTNQVGGEFMFDAAVPADAKIGAIKVNARTLKTDSPQRNGMISRVILKSEDAANEFIVFTPSKIEGVPAQVKEGDSFPLSVTGSLLISGTTKDVTFTGTATYVDTNTITASLSTVVKRGDYGLIIPDLSFLANVQEEVTLKADLTATKAE